MLFLIYSLDILYSKIPDGDVLSGGRVVNAEINKNQVISSQPCSQGLSAPGGSKMRDPGTRLITSCYYMASSLSGQDDAILPAWDWRAMSRNNNLFFIPHPIQQILY